MQSEMELSPPKEFVGLRVKMRRMHIPSAPSKSQQKVKGFWNELSQRGQGHNLPGGGNGRDTPVESVYTHLSWGHMWSCDVNSVLELAS